MTNNSIYPALENSESTFEIDIVNKVSKTTLPHVEVDVRNQLGQIADAYGGDIGIDNVSGKILFENKRTGVTTNDSNETVEGLGLRAGDVLAVSYDCNVA